MSDGRWHDLAWRWHWALRATGAALLLAMSWIHWYLYDLGYSSIPTIGELFLLNAVFGVLAAVALLSAPARWLVLVELGGGLLLLGTLAGLFVSATVGLFGLTETWDAPLVGRTIVVETAGSVLLIGAALLHRRPRSSTVRAELGQDGTRAS